MVGSRTWFAGRSSMKQGPQLSAHIASIAACTRCSSVVQRWRVDCLPAAARGGTIALPDVYVPKLVAPTLGRKTIGAWRRSGPNGVITGRAAASMHGALWVNAMMPIEMIWRSGRPPPGIVVRNERIDTD